ncbi:hypothetical protein R5R35_007839 [Gryllus longicercus]|uniref:Protein GUCD1 n=1 Tax=Gryllus longicercus TaxID=2509291 RepID=A0AAN9ZI64_9ORTH
MMECHDNNKDLPNVPPSLELIICHQKQRFNWDCGVSCVQMVLSPDLRTELHNNFNEVCREEGFNKSTWTIDLCYLLLRYGVKHCFCTITLGINPGYETQSFYSKVLRKDERRVMQRFSEAKERGIDVQEKSLTHLELIQHLALNGPIILLTNSSLLACETCKSMKLLSELRHWLPWSVNYNGHYVVLCGYNLAKKKFYYHNPSLHDRICCMSFTAMDEARCSYGTDEDVILIYSNNFGRKVS